MLTIADLPIEYIRNVCGPVSVLLTIAALMGSIYAFNMLHHRRYGVSFIVAFLLSLFYMLGFESICIMERIDISEFYLEQMIRKIPVTVMIFTFILCLGMIINLWLMVRKYMRTQLTPTSLQEGLDSLSDGVYYGTEDGIPLLINRKMQEIMNAAFNKTVNVTALLKEPLEADDIRDGCRRWCNDLGTFVGLADGTVWDIHDKMIPMRRGRRDTHIQEILAYDITKRYEKSVELEERNKHLNAINDKLREYSRNLDSTTRQREMLNAKIRLHDDVGRCLLALRAYLASGGKSDDVSEISVDGVSAGNEGNLSDSNSSSERTHLEELWKATIAVLNNESERTEDVDRMSVMIKAADAVGVSLIINGNIDSDMEELVAAAIHECLTNTVKHADGKTLIVDIDSQDTNWKVRITNDGRPPESEIKETGGLGNLRSMVVLKGGTMDVISHPKFELIISNKKKL